MPWKPLSAFAFSALSLIVAVPLMAGAEQSVLKCVSVEADNGDGYEFIQKSGADLFGKQTMVAGAVVQITVIADVESLAVLESASGSTESKVWIGIGSLAGTLARVRVPDDKNKTYQIDLTKMRGTVIQGYRPVAQLECLLTQ